MCRELYRDLVAVHKKKGNVGTAATTTACDAPDTTDKETWMRYSYSTQLRCKAATFLAAGMAQRVSLGTFGRV